MRSRRAIFILRSTWCFALSPLMLDMKPLPANQGDGVTSETGTYPGDTCNRKEDTGHAFFQDSKLNREGAKIDG